MLGQQRGWPGTASAGPAVIAPCAGTRR